MSITRDTINAEAAKRTERGRAEAAALDAWFAALT